VKCGPELSVLEVDDAALAVVEDGGGNGGEALMLRQRLDLRQEVKDRAAVGVGGVVHLGA
jgi:hypothetical protein